MILSVYFDLTVNYHFENHLKDWIADSKQERINQWKEIMREFDLFDRVESKTTSTLVLIPIDQLMLESSFDAVKAHWHRCIGCKFPKCISYAIYDKADKISFLGETQKYFLFKFNFYL